MDVSLVLEKTEATPDHYGDLAEVDIGKDTLMASLLIELIVGANDGDLDINGQRRRVGQITEPGVIGEHRQDGTIVLKDGWLSQLGLLKLDLDLVLVADSGTGGGESGSRSGNSGGGSLRLCIICDRTHKSIGS